METPIPSFRRKPFWLRSVVSCAGNGSSIAISREVSRKLNTICDHGQCPNRWECYSGGCAAFLIMGNICSRNCRFCAVQSDRPVPLDVEEPQRLACVVRERNLRYVVITSVTRDDLRDGGAGHFARTIEAIREQCPETKIEVLVPDFGGNEEALKNVLAARPDVFNHNLETVERVFSEVRPQGSYWRSLELLSYAHQWGHRNHPSMVIKSGLMLGMGETSAEIQQTLEVLLKAGCRLLTLGQYLPPSPKYYSLHRYLLPWEFDAWRENALKIGFAAVASGPLVRSSHQADKLLMRLSI